MYDLEMWEGDGRTRRSLGVLRLREVRSDPLSGTVTLEVARETGQALATVQVLAAEATARPWTAALVALQKLYGSHVFYPTLRDDGMCNAVTTVGKRCRLPSEPDGYFCVIHDPLRSR